MKTFVSATGKRVALSSLSAGEAYAAVYAAVEADEQALDLFSRSNVAEDPRVFVTWLSGEAA